MVVKILFKVTAMLVVLVGGLTYMMYLTTGKVPFDFGDLESMKAAVKIPFQDEVVNLKPELEQSGDGQQVLRAGEVKVFKWQDEHGQWHYSEKPPEGVKSKALVLDRELNVVAGVRRRPEEPAPVKKEPDKPEAGLPTGMPYSKEKVEKLFEDTKNLQEVLDARAKQQEQLLKR